MRRRLFKTIILFIAVSAVLSYSFPAAVRAWTNPYYVRVIKAYDGDTVSLFINGKREKARLIGIDTPELRQRPWGLKAKKHLEELLGNSAWTVAVEFDVERRDKYGRLLCYLRTSGGKMINLQMVKDGYAMLLTIPPNVKHVDELRKAQHEARQQGLGIWGKKGLKERPGDYRKKHPYR